jgi:hypothetical protein
MGDSRSLLEEELNRYWNALVAEPHHSPVPPGSLDPTTAETLRWLAHLGTSPAPAASRARLQHGLQRQLHLHPPTDAERRGPTLPLPMRPLHVLYPPAVDPRGHGPLGADLPRSPVAPGNGRVHEAETSGIGWTYDVLAPPSTTSRHPLVTQAHAVTRVAAAIILGVAIVSALVALLYPVRPWQIGERAPMAGSNPPTAEAALTGETTLIDVIITNMPTYRAQLDLAIVTLPPGTQLEQRSGAGSQLFYVADGPVTVRAGTAPEPLEVIPAESTGAQPPKTLIAQGEQATIETGTVLLAPGGAVIDLFTTEPTAARVLDLLSATDSWTLNHGATRQTASNGGMAVVLAAPVSIALRQGGLAPEATVPAPASGAMRQVVAPLEVADMGNLRSGTDGAVRNAGEQPVDLYVLTVTTGEMAVVDDENG